MDEWMDGWMDGYIDTIDKSLGMETLLLLGEVVAILSLERAIDVGLLLLLLLLLL